MAGGAEGSGGGESGEASADDDYIGHRWASLKSRHCMDGGIDRLLGADGETVALSAAAAIDDLNGEPDDDGDE
jgi:hypothetical protein